MAGLKGRGVLSLKLLHLPWPPSASCHAASMPYPAFFRLDNKTIDEDLLLPRGMHDRLATLLERAG